MLVSVIKQMLRPARPAPYFDERILTQRITERSAALQQGYLRYPALVHIETLAACNAACTFCPYPRLERKGVRMPDELIAKIIGDLADIPREHVFQIAPYKVSEPFLEARLFDILHEINERLPQARISLISNGAAVTPAKIDRLRAVRNIAYLSISLNFIDADEYQAVMKIPFERTLQRLDALHAAAGQLAFPVRLTRVSADNASDEAFHSWARGRYPAFKSTVLPRNDWIGDIANEHGSSTVPDAPCHRWFDLSITATGVVAMCCMDGDARYPKGDVRTQHVLDLYNQPHLLERRAKLTSRRLAGDPCNRCTYLSF